ncbi:carboxylesterase family protein [Agreia pratensis]|uniref:carboxylesterase family protein n=1 Tax=Agreia pratensis TaxID=150121 RepID=UPI00188B8726|nr:carboxylesterase family protein [Agreia pratensis]MBF4632835.1 carboxylesterase family protein [Agreia pratensis]
MPTYEVTCAAGTIVGFNDGLEARFLGIPFAEAPTGSRRFAAPVPRGVFAEPFSASAFGATPQRGQPYPVTTIPEPSIPGDDTLTLNVFAPHDAITGEPAPVLVWIHGGGYVAGSAASPWYGCAPVVRDGIVFVSISYRLGVDGFAAVDGQADRGVADWLLALAWVRDNIAAFGGDPARVTVAGQSAGGGAVLALLASPQAQPLFHRAIAVSPIDISTSLDEARRRSAVLAKSLGVEPTAEGFGSIDPDALQDAVIHWGERHPQAGELSLAPVSGGELLPLSIREGLGVNGLDKPLLIGSTADEFDSPGAGGRATPAVFPRETDTLFRAAVLRTARARASAPAGTWLYSFDWASPIVGGAAHCIDLPFFFDIFGADGVEAVLGSDAPAALADRMHREFVAFVRGEEPSWPAARGVEADPVLVFGADSTATTRLVEGAYDDVLPLL